MRADAPCLLWLRRDLRLDDHAALWHALETGAPVQPVFVFDSDILARFPGPHDRRLCFIAAALCRIDFELKKRGGRLLVVHGRAGEVIPKLAVACGAKQLFAAEDYEPDTIRRDAQVRASLQGITKVAFVKDHVVFSPAEVLRDEVSPFKVFTPYANAWRARLTPVLLAPYDIKDHGRYADSKEFSAHALSTGLILLDPAEGPTAMLAKVGYTYAEDTLWPVDAAQERLQTFIAHKAASYPQQRDMVSEEGTSRLSPYLRFGLVSVRACARAGHEAGADKWLAELIWREFYAMILYHFPEVPVMEWNPRYRNRLHWSDNPAHLKAWQEGKTGYPLVDAAMRQLVIEGWMHNRARMVVASFLTKHLRIDWRKGEEFFARYLMDYDLASNAGGWQWAASTGTDAQPYFRVFNPVLQSQKFDPEGNYIRRYVPELGNVSKDAIHAPWEHPLLARYYPPMVDHATARQQALEMFKSVSGEDAA